jgi:hypothetical protein
LCVSYLIWVVQPDLVRLPNSSASGVWENPAGNAVRTANEIAGFCNRNRCTNIQTFSRTEFLVGPPPALIFRARRSSRPEGASPPQKMPTDVGTPCARIARCWCRGFWCVRTVGCGLSIAARFARSRTTKARATCGVRRRLTGRFRGIAGTTAPAPAPTAATSYSSPFLRCRSVRGRRSRRYGPAR